MIYLSRSYLFRHFFISLFGVAVQTFTRGLLTLLLMTTLVGCGFHLRGAADLSFKSILIQGNTLTISKKLAQSLVANGVAIIPNTSSPETKEAIIADLQLELIGEENEKRILSLSGKGVVNEFELYYRVHYRTKLEGDVLWSPVQTIEARRDFSYSDANLLAKQGEERRLNENMQADVLSNLMRRLSTLKK